MIQITIEKQAGNYRSFSTTGHAGFARRGKDIVCAAVSILVINTLNSIEKFTDDDFSYELEQKNGFVSAKFSQPNSSDCKLLLDAMVLGLEDISSQYGKLISVIIQEV